MTPSQVDPKTNVRSLEIGTSASCVNSSCTTTSVITAGESVRPGTARPHAITPLRVPSFASSLRSAEDEGLSSAVAMRRILHVALGAHNAYLRVFCGSRIDARRYLLLNI